MASQIACLALLRASFGKPPLNYADARLKLDRSFVTDLLNDEDDKAITRAVISLGHQLNLKIVAEGVETAQQLNFLHENGCEEMQGYYFSQPVPPAEAATLFHRRLTFAAATV